MNQGRAGWGHGGAPPLEGDTRVPALLFDPQHSALGLKGLPQCGPLNFWWPVIFGKIFWGMAIRGSKVIRNTFLPNDFGEQMTWSVCREEQSSPCQLGEPGSCMFSSTSTSLLIHAPGPLYMLLLILGFNRVMSNSNRLTILIYFK